MCTLSPLPAGPCNLLDLLPSELLHLIIAEHLEDCADIQALSRTCHALHRLHSLTSSTALEAAWLWRWHGDQAFFHRRSLASMPVLRQLVEVHHADVNAQGPDESLSLLHLACEADRSELVGFLISVLRINVNLACWEELLTPLHVACLAGSFHAVRQLLALPQIQVNAAASHGLSSLHLACSDEVVEELLRHPDIDVNLMTVVNARSPLDMAAAAGGSAIVALLLQHPAINVNAAGALGISLHQAVIWKHPKVLRQLLRHPGIQVNALDPSGRTALFLACEQASSDLVVELLRHPDTSVNMEAPELGHCTLRFAALRNNPAIVALLLQHPAIDVNATDVQGQSPLYLACSYGNFLVVRAQLRHPDIDVNATTAAEISSLGIACLKRHAGVIQELLGHPGLSPGSIRAVLAVAEAQGQTAVVELLNGRRAVRRAMRGR